LNIYDLYGRIVTPSGAFLGSEFSIVTNQSKSAPFLAFDGANYLFSWSVPTSSNVLFQFLNGSGRPIGCQFAPFTAQGNEVPWVAPVLFDGKRFVSVGTLSSSVSSSFSGTGFSPPAYGAGVYGTFIPKSTAPQFLGGVSYTNKQFTLSLTGTPGIYYAIEMATNLIAPNWTSLATNSPTNGTFTFTDTGATNRSRFYRAIKQ
jgi:hypothetical protein